MPNEEGRPVTTIARPRRILWVEMCADGTTGGTHQMLIDFARHLDRRRFQLVALFHQMNRFVPLLRDLDVEVIDFSAVWATERAPHISDDYFGKIRSILKAPLTRAQLLREYSIDLLYLVNTPANGFGDWLPAVWLVGIPSVVCTSGPYVPPKGAIRRWLTRRHFSVVSLSNYVTETLTSQGMPADRIHLIYPGVDIEAFRHRVTRPAAEVRADLGVSDDSVLAVMVGNVRHWKG